MERTYTLINARNGDFIIDPKDHIGYTMATQGSWESYLTEIISRIVMPNWVAIDAGANFGPHTITLGKSLKKVYAFECQKIIYNQLCANIMLNGLDYKVDTFNVAVGDKKETKQLWKIEFEQQKDGFCNWGGRGIEQDFIPYDINFDEYRENDQVQVETLDSYNFDQCDLIKMDIQGYELKALIGGKNLINKHKPVLLLENECKEKTELEQNIKTKQHLINLGYEVYRLEFDPIKFPAAKDYTRDNIIVIHPENKYYHFIENINRLH